MPNAKHAYLIIAHNEFEVLQSLITAIDDERNDIFIHIDKKVKKLPSLSSTKSNLMILDQRLDVIWGDVSQIKTECHLLQSALEYGHYEYYHIISGVHFPLKSQNEIHRFFEGCNGHSVLTPMNFKAPEAEFKLGRHHFFLKHLLSPDKTIFKICHILWRIPLYIEKKINITRKIEFPVKKTANWCSLTENAVICILNEKDSVIKRFRHTFCADEYFKMAILGKYNIPVIMSENLLFTDFTGAAPETLSEKDFEVLIKSNCIFARKFSKKDKGIIEKIKHEIA